MSIELTEQQQQALDAQAETPPLVIDPRNNAAYFLIPAPDYEAIRDAGIVSCGKCRSLNYDW